MLKWRDIFTGKLKLFISDSFNNIWGMWFSIFDLKWEKQLSIITIIILILPVFFKKRNPSNI